MRYRDIKKQCKEPKRLKQTDLSSDGQSDTVDYKNRSCGKNETLSVFFCTNFARKKITTTKYSKKMAY